jgi:hypothetical protein
MCLLGYAAMCVSPLGVYQLRFASSQTLQDSGQATEAGTAGRVRVR